MVDTKDCEMLRAGFKGVARVALTLGDDTFSLWTADVFLTLGDGTFSFWTLCVLPFIGFIMEFSADLTLK